MPHAQRWIALGPVTTLVVVLALGCVREEATTQVRTTGTSGKASTPKPGTPRPTPSTKFASQPPASTTPASPGPSPSASAPPSTGASPSASPSTPAASATPSTGPTPTPTPSETASAAPTPTPTPTATPTPAPSASVAITYTTEAFKVSALAGGQPSGEPRSLQTGDNAAIGLNLEGVGMAARDLPSVFSYFSDAANGTIRSVNKLRQVLWEGVGDPAAADPPIRNPRGLAYDPVRKVLYVADSFNHRILRVGYDGNTVGLQLASFDVIAGRKDMPVEAPYLDGAGATANLMTPHGLLLAEPNLYFTDAGYHTLRKIDLSSATFPVSFVAGGQSTTPGAAVAGAVAAGEARFNLPTALTATVRGTDPLLVVADSFNHCLRSVNPLTGEVSLLAGSASGVTGAEDGSATAARFNHPVALAGDGRGRVFVGERNNPRLRVLGADGEVRTALGGAAAGYVNATGAPARFGAITGMAQRLDGTGNLLELFIYDAGTAENLPRLRLVEPQP